MDQHDHHRDSARDSLAAHEEPQERQRPFGQVAAPAPAPPRPSTTAPSCSLLLGGDLQNRRLVLKAPRSARQVWSPEMTTARGESGPPRRRYRFRKYGPGDAAGSARCFSASSRHLTLVLCVWAPAPPATTVPRRRWQPAVCNLTNAALTRLGWNASIMKPLQLILDLKNGRSSWRAFMGGLSRLDRTCPLAIFFHRFRRGSEAFSLWWAARLSASVAQPCRPHVTPRSLSSLVQPAQLFDIIFKMPSSSGAKKAEKDILLNQ